MLNGYPSDDIFRCACDKEVPETEPAYSPSQTERLLITIQGRGVSSVDHFDAFYASDTDTTISVPILDDEQTIISNNNIIVRVKLWTQLN